MGFVVAACLDVNGMEYFELEIFWVGYSVCLIH